MAALHYSFNLRFCLIHPVSQIPYFHLDFFMLSFTPKPQALRYTCTLFSLPSLPLSFSLFISVFVSFYNRCTYEYISSLRLPLCFLFSQIHTQTYMRISPLSLSLVQISNPMYLFFNYYSTVFHFPIQTLFVYP